MNKYSILLLILLTVLPTQVRAVDGDLDVTFGIAGNASSGFPDINDTARALVIQPDGKIVVGGSTDSLSSLIHLDRTAVAVNTSFTATFSGANINDRTYFDVRFRSPEISGDQVALDWQQGLSAPHRVAADTPAGTYVVTSIRPHKEMADSGGDFLMVSAALTVAP